MSWRGLSTLTGPEFPISERSADANERRHFRWIQEKIKNHNKKKDCTYPISMTDVTVFLNNYVCIFYSTRFTFIFHTQPSIFFEKF